MLANNKIKPLFVTEEYEICEGYDCMFPTGKNCYEEVNLDFSVDAKKEVLNLFNKLSWYSQNKIIDTRNIKLDIQDGSIFHALLLNNEDTITLSKNFVFDTDKIAMATYLNKIVDAEFDDINKLAMEQIENQYNQ